MKHMRFVFIALALLLLAAAPALAQAGGQLKVTILIYSGQPNPSYTIDKPDDIAGLRALFQGSLAKGGAAKKFAPKFGYTGLYVENVGNAAGLPERFYVYNGRIYVPSLAQGALPDDNRSLEKMLFDMGAAEGKISPKMKKYIK
jgi:hypothetical protein